MKNLISFILLFCFQVIFSQSNQDKAFEMGQQGVKLIDNRHFDEAIVLLEKAQDLDQNSIIYPYEIAYASYFKQDYKKAINILKKIQNHIDANDRVFQLLGNSFDKIGKQEESQEVYKSGIIRFPNSGSLYGYVIQ